ncbi:MAG: HEAT repeat domain-containing protein [Candidatus Thorarchaeota archaeon]
MSKDLKDLIDSIDSANSAHSELETIIRYLKEEVQKLNFTINEQKRIIQNQKLKLSNFESSTIPEDVEVLKELIIKQREELIKKDKDIEILTQTIEDITVELEKAKNFDEEDEEIVYSNKVIVQLTEENEMYRAEIEKLEARIYDLEDAIQIYENEDYKKIEQKLVDTKKLIFQLTEENGLNRVQIESLKREIEDLQSSLQESELNKNEYMHELENNNQIIDGLKDELSEYKEKVEYLQNKLEDMKKIQESFLESSEEYKKLLEFEAENDELKNIIGTNLNIIENLKNENLELNNKLTEALQIINSNKDDYDKTLIENEEKLAELNKKYQKIQNANKKLSDLIVELKVKGDSITPQVAQSNLSQPISKESQLNYIPPSLFHKMFELLDAENKKQIINQLIEDLNENNIRDKRIYALKILSSIDGPRIFEEFKKLIKDKDWIIKLYIIKALNNFKNTEVKDILKELQKDGDVDVREAATNLLCKFEKI